MKPSLISVLVADDHAIVRESLRAVLQFEHDIVVCAFAQHGRGAVRLAAEHQPDVIVMDIAMPILNGVEATRQILRENSRARVIVLSAHDEEGYVLRVIKAGALGYLLKHASAEMLGQAIREVHRGGAFFSPGVAKHIAAHCHNIAAFRHASTSLAALTARECEVLQMIAEGYGTKQIAVELGLSGKTVEKHRQRLMEKLEIHNIAGLTRYAVIHGVIDCHGTPFAAAEAAQT
jgi:DNA-binding NarL/FixJ family response regulator